MQKSLNNFTLLVCVLIVLSFSFIESNMTVTGGVTRSYATINSLNKQEVNIVVNLTVNIICCAQFRQGNSSKQNLTEWISCLNKSGAVKMNLHCFAFCDYHSNEIATVFHDWRFLKNSDLSCLILVNPILCIVSWGNSLVSSLFMTYACIHHVCVSRCQQPKIFDTNLL